MMEKNKKFRVHVMEAERNSMIMIQSDQGDIINFNIPNQELQNHFDYTGVETKEDALFHMLKCSIKLHEFIREDVDFEYMDIKTYEKIKEQRLEN